MRNNSKWRYYDPEKYPGDVQAVADLHREQELRLGQKMDQPDIGVAPVIVSVVREVEGRVTHCIFLEAEAEACALGSEPLTSEEAQEAVRDFLLPVAKKYKLRIVRSFMPEGLVSGKQGRLGPVARLLGKLGFTREDGHVVQFFKWIIPPAESGKENGHR